MIRRIAILSLALVFAGCQPGGGGGKKKGASEKPDDGEGDADADGNPKPAVDPKEIDKPQDKTFCESVKDDGRGDLEEYLYTPKEACEIDPWALKYQAAKNGVEETREVFKEGEEVRAYMEDFLNRVAKLDVVKPGRKFKVSVYTDEEQNAYADGRQNIVVNSAFLKNKTDPEAMLGILCHEMIHSLRNDGTELENYYEKVLIDDEAKNPKAKAIYDKIQDYFNRTYNDQNQTYTHDKSEWEKVNTDWKAYKKKAWNFSKRLEATADVIGGSLCAAIGMKASTFRGVFEELKSDEESQPYRTTDQIRNGEKLQIPSDTVFALIFSDDSHPTYDERIEQINRVSGFLAQHQGDKKELLEEWNKKFPALLKKAGLGTGVSLTDGPPVLEGDLRVKNLTTGETDVFKVRKTHAPGRRH